MRREDQRFPVPSGFAKAVEYPSYGQKQSHELVGVVCEQDGQTDGGNFQREFTADAVANCMNVNMGM